MEAKESANIIRKAIDRVSEATVKYGNIINEIVKKELVIRRTKNPMARLVLVAQIKKLEEEGKQLLCELHEAEKAALSIADIDEHIECIAKENREVANSIIRTINTIKYNSRNRRY